MSLEIKMKPGLDFEEELAKLHPLFIELCFHLTDDGDVAPEGIAKVKAGLDELRSKPVEFAKAIDELNEGAGAWDTVLVEGKIPYQPAAKRVFGLIRSPEMMQAYSEAKAKEAESGREFGQFADKEAPKAPKVGEAAPEGSVKLDKFNYPRKL